MRATGVRKAEHSKGSHTLLVQLEFTDLLHNALCCAILRARRDDPIVALVGQVTPAVNCTCRGKKTYRCAKQLCQISHMPTNSQEI